ncbi:MAG: hypothetical protein HYZ00_05825, partial [Candidatus Hydrogenedentes bacterium]|nr:hypothetical protein [Candidatus Hydrogenedentota bacterium]
VMALLRQLGRDGYGIALVTHDLNLAARFCDRIVLLGATHCIVADGRPEEVLTGLLLSEAYGSTIRVGQHPFAPAPFVMATLPEGDGS